MIIGVIAHHVHSEGSHESEGRLRILISTNHGQGTAGSWVLSGAPLAQGNPLLLFSQEAEAAPSFTQDTHSS